MTDSLGVRLKRAGAALLGIFRPEARTQAFGLLTGTYGASGLPPARTAQAYLEAYSTMPWLRAVAGKVTHAVSVVPWQAGYRTAPGKAGAGISHKAMRDRALMMGTAAMRLARRKELGEDYRELETHPALTVLDAGNPFMGGIAVRQITALHVDILGEGFWLMERNGAGMPIRIWPVPPTWVRETPSLTRPTYDVQVSGWHGQIPDTEMIWFRHPDPASPYGRGTGVVQSLGDELDTDEFAAKTIKTWFGNRARPDITVSPRLRENEEAPSPAEINRLKENWLADHEGFQRASRPYFSSLPIDVNVISQTFQEMQIIDLRKYERDTILQVYAGVPPEWLGIIENSNRATIDSADYLAQKQIIAPRLEFLRGVLQTQFAPQFDPRLVLDYENPIMEDREYHLKVMTVAPEVPTVDEWRAAAGLPATEDGTGESHLVRLGIEVRPTLDEPAGEAIITPEGTPSPAQVGLP